MRFLIFILALLAVVQMSSAQSDGKYLELGDPLLNQWKFMGDKEDAAPIAGNPQQFIFPKALGSSKSFMAPFVEGEAYPCATYFTISKNDKILFLKVNNSCVPEFNEQEIVVNYSIGQVKSTRTIEINDKSTIIENFKWVLTLIIDGTTYHYQAIE